MADKYRDKAKAARRLRKTYEPTKSDCIAKGMGKLKKAFSEQAAKKRAAELDMRAYECPVCGRWHITKVKEWK